MEASIAPDVEGLEEEVKELLSPLLSKLDEIVSAEEDLEIRRRMVKSERLRIERLLKAGGLIEKETRNKNGRSRSVEATTPNQGAPLTERGKENLEVLEKAVEDFDGEPFQTKMLMAKTGISRGGCESAIGYMRGSDKIRLLGNRPQIGRTAPGGRPAATYQEIR